jgi:hypothetical protein
LGLDRFHFVLLKDDQPHWDHLSIIRFLWVIVALDHLLVVIYQFKDLLDCWNLILKRFLNHELKASGFWTDVCKWSVLKEGDKGLMLLFGTCLALVEIGIWQIVTETLINSVDILI